MAVIEVRLPTLHTGQVEIYRNRAKFNAVRCGRRFGKTKMMVTLAADGSVKSKKVGLFAPEHKQLNEPYTELLWVLGRAKQKANKNEGTIHTTTGGQIDFWTLNDNDLAGRGREYDEVLIDEAAFTKDSQMGDIWEKSIKPTMLTRPKARVWVLSTPNGDNPENFFWRVCNDPKMGFRQHYAPSVSNPYVLAEEIEKKRLETHPLVFRQEYLAEFVDFSGDAFFQAAWLLEDGRPVPYPTHCDAVFAVIDTAVKTGTDNDGTAVSYWALSNHVGHPLVCLDWDYVQIEGAMLEVWIPSVLARLEALALECRARGGSKGVFIEDAQSGSILLQQCVLRGLPATPLPQELTSAGKDWRAINASGPVYQGKVKWSQYAYDKVLPFKGTVRNHMIAQVNSFRVGDKDAAKRSDDLLDTFTYSVAIALGNREGIG